MGVGQMLDDVDHMSRRLWRYWKQAVTTPISGSDVVDSFTTLENYEAPATFLATGGAATIKSAASLVDDVGKVGVKAAKEAVNPIQTNYKKVFLG